MCIVRKEQMTSFLYRLECGKAGISGTESGRRHTISILERASAGWKEEYRKEIPRNAGATGAVVMKMKY